MTPKKSIINTVSLILLASSSTMAENLNQGNIQRDRNGSGVENRDRGGGGGNALPPGRGGNPGRGGDDFGRGGNMPDRGGGRDDQHRPPPYQRPGNPPDHRPSPQPPHQQPPPHRPPPQPPIYRPQPPIHRPPPDSYRPVQPPHRRPPIRHVRPAPPPPRFIPVLPDRPWHPDRPGQPGYIEREYEYLGQFVENSEIPLRALFDIDREFYGYTIDSIQVEVSSAGFRNTRLSLEVNGQRVDSEFDPQGWITLDPGMWDQIGTEIRTLRLDVQGRLHIGGIYINLRRFSDDGSVNPNPGPGYQTIQLSVPGYLLPRRMFGNDQISLGQMINLNDYVGYKLDEVVIEGEALYNNALLDVIVEGMQVGPSMVFGSQIGQIQVLRPNIRQAVSVSYDSILLRNRGDLNLRQITLRLSRW
ncbi:MAG TPA: hypothetical protein PLJ21_09920 [Pseudobdellovibrionaceae bacterium]|nr:hypothetical protein [Pseudobdellovibrionaceae bacterium]